MVGGFLCFGVVLGRAGRQLRGAMSNKSNLVVATMASMSLLIALRALQPETGYIDAPS
jgi:hypothetical protein